MDRLPDFADFAALVKRLDPGLTLRAVRALEGGVSARVQQLEVVSGREVYRLVVRAHGEMDRARNPSIARDEHRLLSVLFDAGLPVPQAHGVDEHLMLAPVLIVSYIDGAPEFSTRQARLVVDALATVMARIHQVPTAELQFLESGLVRTTRLLDRLPAAPNDEFSEQTLRSVLRPRWPPVCDHAAVLVHADLWPGNLIFRDGHLAGVIDWEDAALCDPLVDLAKSRLEIRAFYSEAAMIRLTKRFAEMGRVNLDQLPLFDLAAALDMASGIQHWGLAPSRYAKMRDAHSAFVREALALL